MFEIQLPGNPPPQTTRASTSETSALSVVANFICCSPPVVRWENGSWERTFQARSKNCPLELRSSANLGCLPAFVRIPSERLGLALVPPCRLPCAFCQISCTIFHLFHKRAIQAPGTRGTFLIRAHWDSWCGTGNEVPNV